MNQPRAPIVSRALLISLLALAVLAFAGASGAGPLGLIVASEDPVVVVDEECPEEGDDVAEEDPEGELGDPDGEGEDPEGGDPEGEDPEECEDVEEGEDLEEGEDVSPQGDPEAREAECNEAAGLVDEEGNAQSVEDAYADVAAPFGQMHSMEVLLANCVKNPQASGLLRALENHARHLERWEARAELRAEREAQKAERKAAREAAKAERAAARAEAKAARAEAKAAAGHGGGKGKGH